MAVYFACKFLCINLFNFFLKNLLTFYLQTFLYKKAAMLNIFLKRAPTECRFVIGLIYDEENLPETVKNIKILLL